MNWSPKCRRFKIHKFIIQKKGQPMILQDPIKMFTTRIEQLSESGSMKLRKQKTASPSYHSLHGIDEGRIYGKK